MHLDLPEMIPPLPREKMFIIPKIEPIAPATTGFRLNCSAATATAGCGSSHQQVRETQLIALCVELTMETCTVPDVMKHHQVGILWPTEQDG
jgi:hypothetical protein